MQVFFEKILLLVNVFLKIGSAYMREKQYLCGGF